MVTSPVPPTESLFEIVHGNLREAMQFFGTATGRGEISPLSGAVAIYSGLEYGVFNIGMLDGSGLPPTIGNGLSLSQGAQPDFAARLQDCAAYFAPRSARWSFWLCDNAVPRGEKTKVQAAFSRLGFDWIADAPGMWTEALLPPTRPLPAVDCLPVDNQGAREAFGAIISVAFDIPMPVAQAVYYPERAWQGAYQGFIGMANGRPVSAMALVAAHGVLGVYSLATLPEERGRGYGEALLRAAVEAHYKRTGLQRLVLQSTEAGYTLYRRLGFRDVARFSVYLRR